MKTLAQRAALVAILAATDLTAGAATSSWTDVSDCRRFRVGVKVATPAGGATVSVQLRQAKTSVGGTAKNLGTAYEVVVVAGATPADILLEKSIDDVDAANGFKYVAVVVTVTETDAGGTPEVALIAPQDVGTADVTGAYVDVTAWKSFCIVSKAGAVTAAKILTAQVKAASDGAGTGAANVGAAATAAGAGGNAPATIRQAVNVADLPAGKPFVTVVLGIDEDTKLGAAVLVRTDRGISGSAWLERADLRYSL